jgi:YhcH/YjgK/YiaL family protein
VAIIGKLSSVQNLFFKDQLRIVFDYLNEAIDVHSVVHRRIFSRPVGAFERVDLTDNIFALEQVFETKNHNECFYESHRKYVDFQLNLSGIEQMEWIHREKMIVLDMYNDKADLIKYQATAEASKLVMKSGDLAIYYPDDVHMGISKFNDSKSLVYKTVVKVPVINMITQ